MQALRLYGVKDLRLENIPAPSAVPAGHVRLEVLAAGICGSDIHNLQTGEWISRVPSTPGHEFCARITELGAGVSDFHLGQRVVVDSRVGCGHCAYCRAGKVNLCAELGFVGEVCDGGFAQQSIQPVNRLLPVPEGISDAVAALSEPLGVALRVVHQLGAPEGASVLIAGGGTIGGLSALLLSEIYHCKVSLLEKNPARLALLQSVTEIHATSLETLPAFDYVVEATGSAVVVNALLSKIAPAGKIAMVGLFHGAPALDINRVVEREIRLVGSSVFVDEQKEALALLPRLADKLAVLIEDNVPLEAIIACYEQLSAGNSDKLKTMIRPNGAA